MGRGMALNLLKKGFTLVVWNRTPEKCAELVAGHDLCLAICSLCGDVAGATAVATPGDVIKGADITFACLADPDIALSVAFGPDGVVQGTQITPRHVHRRWALARATSTAVPWTRKLRSRLAMPLQPQADVSLKPRSVPPESSFEWPRRRMHGGDVEADLVLVGAFHPFCLTRNAFARSKRNNQLFSP
eukprot:3311841-Rhodomonas_salina.1